MADKAKSEAKDKAAEKADEQAAAAADEQAAAAADEQAAADEAKDSDGGTGDGENMTPPDSEESLDEKTKTELYDLAKEADIEGRSSMDKEELVEALEREQATQVVAAPPSMTDRAQATMVQGAEFGRQERKLTIAGNRAKRDQQQEALRRTNRPDNA